MRANTASTPSRLVDAAVDLSKPSTNTIIYGHNIRTDGQMFNILKGYTSLEYYQQHPVIQFDSVYREGKYKIVSIFYTNTLAEHGEIFPYHEFIDAASEQETQEYIDDVLIRSIINTGVDVLPSDELLTLSTCTYEFHEARFGHRGPQGPRRRKRDSGHLSGNDEPQPALSGYLVPAVRRHQTGRGAAQSRAARRAINKQKHQRRN